MSKNLGQLKVAIVHDWLVGGGAELVVEQLHQMFPDAPIYTSYATPQWRERLNGKVVTGWLQHFGKVRKFIPYLRAWWFSHLNVSDYDLVISSSGAEAKGVRVKPGALHINYCHTPTHYYWSRYDEYMKHPGFGRFDGVARLGLMTLVGPMRRWDLRAARRPDIMIANSNHIREEIKKYYKRDAVVVHPPVDIARFKPKGAELRHGFVTAGRQTPYKRIDLAVEAFADFNEPLIVIGNGPDHKKLEKMASRNVTFLSSLSDDDVAEHFRTAKAFIFPGLDDFGITPVEAMAAGTPVIAYQAGGALDYVVPGKTGEFFSPQTPQALRKVLENFNPNQYKAETLQAKAAEFSPAAFQAKLREIIEQVLQNT